MVATAPINQTCLAIRSLAPTAFKRDLTTTDGPRQQMLISVWVTHPARPHRLPPLGGGPALWPGAMGNQHIDVDNSLRRVVVFVADSETPHVRNVGLAVCGERTNR